MQSPKSEELSQVTPEETPKTKEQSKEKSKFSNSRQTYISFITGLVVVAVCIVICFFFVIGVTRVDGDSMVPTLTNNQTMIFFRLNKNYQRGDIVGLSMPNGDYYVKRVIGVAGDTIDIHDGKVFVNGNQLDEPYIQGTTEPSGVIVSYPLTVSEGKVFVLGDNREHSTDSRALGEFSLHAVRGKILGK